MFNAGIHDQLSVNLTVHGSEGFLVNVYFQEDLDRPYYQDPMPNMSVQKSNMPRQGVVKFTPEQLNNVVDAILSTANKVQVPRCGASYLLFMALRHTDNTNDDNLLKVRTLPCSDDRAIRTDILFLI